MDIHVRMAYWKSSVSNNSLIFFLSSPIAFASSTQLLCRWAILATGHNAQNLPLITKSVLNEFTPAGLQWHGLNESKCSSWKLKYIWLYEPSLHHFPTLVPTVPALVPNGMAKVASLACCMCFPHQGSTEYSQDIPGRSHHGNILKTSHGAIMAIHQALLLHADCIASFWTGNSGEYKHISLEGSSSIKLGQNSKQAPFDMILYAFYLLVSFLHPLTLKQ